MKLYASTASPYVRKVKVVAHELGLLADLEIINLSLSPLAPAQELQGKNPLGKIPLLELDNGEQLADSRVICEYLNSLQGEPLLAASGSLRWQTLHLQALADGMLDAGVVVRYESFLRPEALRWPDWLQAHCRKITQTLDLLESQLGHWPSHQLEQPNLGNLSLAVTLEWLSFRQILNFATEAPIDAPSRWPALHKWLASFGQRASLLSTRPQG